MSRAPSLSRTEAVSIRLALAGGTSRDRELLVAAGLSKRTFQRIRRSAYSHDWLFDRYLPNFRRFGLISIACVLERPYAGDLAREVARLEALQSNVVLWKWPETIFGLFVSSSPPSELLASVATCQIAGRIASVAVEASSRAVPSYFDYEGAWGRWTDLGGAIRYPQPLLDDRTVGEATQVPRGRPRAAVASLLARGGTSRTGADRLQVSPLFLPRAERLALADRLVERRTFVSVQSVPPGPNGPLTHVAIVHGKLIDPGTGDELFRLLLALRIFPFLFLTSDSQAMFTTLSPAPRWVAGVGGRPDVLGSLGGLMTEIEIVRQPIPDLEVIVNHRYEQLLQTEGAWRLRGEPC